MEFYKIVKEENQYQLQEEAGQDGAELGNAILSQLSLKLSEYHAMQDVIVDALPLRFRKYMTVYHGSGALEYVALSDGAVLLEQPAVDGFAHTWLEGEEENRVWFGADGAVENRGPSAEKVRIVLENLLEHLNKAQ